MSDNRDDMTELNDEQMQELAGGFLGFFDNIPTIAQRDIHAFISEAKARGLSREQAASEFCANIPRSKSYYGIDPDAVTEFVKAVWGY